MAVTSAALVERAIAALRQGDQVKAQLLLEQAVQRDPRDPVARHNLAELHYRQGRLEPAQAMFVQLVNDVPDFLPAYPSLLDLLEQRLAAGDAPPEDLRPTLLNNSANVLLGLGRLPEAEQPAAWKPQTLHTQPQPMSHRNLRQCPHALSVPRRAHVPPAEAHLRPLPPRSSVAHTMCRGWPVHVSPTPPSASPPLMPRSFALACTLCCCVSHAYLCCGAPPCRLL